VIITLAMDRIVIRLDMNIDFSEFVMKGFLMTAFQLHSLRLHISKMLILDKKFVDNDIDQEVGEVFENRVSWHIAALSDNLK
jgi:hypothetical protein